MAEELGRTIEPVSTAPSPVQEVQEAERRNIVRRALERLNDKNREAVSLYYIDGLSYEDIAGFLGVTQATVQGRLQRGRATLRKEMLTMVEETFKERELTEDFSDEIKCLLEAAAVRGREHEEAIKRLAGIGSRAVDPLCEVLGDPRIPVRRTAASALCRIGDERALGPILRLLYSDDGPLAGLLLSGCVLSIPGVREELIKLLPQGKWNERLWAIRALSHARGDEEVYDCILRVFRDQDVKPLGLRNLALDVLCRLKPESGVALMLEALAEPAFRRRVWVWSAALGKGLALPIETCLTAFGRDVAPLTRALAGRLVLRHGDAGRTALESLLEEGSPDQRATAALALARPGYEAAFGALVSELLSGYPRRAWVDRVARVVVDHYAKELAAWSNARGATLAQCPAIAWALAQVRIAGGEGTPEDLFRHGTPAVRAAGVKKLAQAKGVAVLPELRDYLREGRPRKVAQEAFWQVYRLRDAAIPVVIDMLESEHWTERKAALCLLRRWGKLTREQRERGESDSHIAVRHAANWPPASLEVTRRKEP